MTKLSLTYLFVKKKTGFSENCFVKKILILKLPPTAVPHCLINSALDGRRDMMVGNLDKRLVGVDGGGRTP